MAKKAESKVSVNKTDKIINEVKQTPVKCGVGDEQIEVLVKPYLTYKDNVNFISDVVSGVVFNEQEIVSYANLEFELRINTIKYFTNVRIPEDYNKQYDLAFSSDIFNMIMAYVLENSKSYWSLRAAVEKQIEFEVNKMQNQFKLGTQQYIETVQAEAQAVIDIVTRLMETFKGIDVDEVAKMIPKFAEATKINEKTLAEAVLDIQQKKEEIKN